jgi:hypothetical protein
MSSNFVIGGGWSAGQVASEDLDNLMAFGHVIGVNDAAIYAAVHDALTMDRLWFENRWRTLRGLGIGQTYVREKCDCNVPRKDSHDNWRTFKHFNRPYPSVTPGELHGGNSGACAVNLAMQRMLEGDNLFLIGFDMCRGPEGQPYWYPPYPWANPMGATKPGHFNQWVNDFEGFDVHARTKKFNVYVVGLRSRIHWWPKIKFEQMMEMIE